MMGTMDMKIKVITIAGPDIGQFPHKVIHPIGYWSPQWSQMWRWLNSTVGEQNVHWCWQISSEICFADVEHASKFALAWT